MASRRSLTLVLVCTVCVMIGCKRDFDGQHPQAVVYQATIAPGPGGDCVQTVGGVATPFIHLVASHGDSVTYLFANNADSVNFPTMIASVAFPGTPFKTAAGVWNFTITPTVGGGNSGPGYLAGGEGTDFSFQYSRVTYNAASCSFPASGMGIHVTQ